jgi:hypothetical protein
MWDCHAPTGEGLVMAGGVEKNRVDPFLFSVERHHRPGIPDARHR